MSGRGVGTNGLGLRQRQILEAMWRNGGQLPSNWGATSAMVRQSLDALAQRGLVEPGEHSHTWRLTKAGEVAL